jgi:hypothetical protein
VIEASTAGAPRPLDILVKVGVPRDGFVSKCRLKGRYAPERG